MTRLRGLAVPGDLVGDTMFFVLCGLEPVGLEVLELGASRGSGGRIAAVVGFEMGSLVRALFGGLTDLRAVGFAQVFCTARMVYEDGDINKGVSILSTLPPLSPRHPKTTCPFLKPQLHLPQPI